MSCSREYYRIVRHSISASVALFGVITLATFFNATAQAQINGVPSSVTSPGFGGRATNGTPPSVTSIGPRGYVPNPSITFSTGRGFHNGDGHHHHHPRNYVDYYPPVVYAVPYAYDLGNEQDNNDTTYDDDANYQGGPTIFDRRGSGPDSYIPPTRDTRPRPATQAPVADPPADDPPQEPTLLVFKDGHKLEVGNYAIIGATLFDLTPGHPRKIALADLNLEETQRENDDRGIVFRLPLTSQAN